MIDRFLFGKRLLGFFNLYFLSMLLPFLIGVLYLASNGELSLIGDWFYSLPCLLLSVSAHLVGLSYSYAFRHYEVKQVIIRSKLPELILPLFFFMPFFAAKFTPSMKSLLPLVITWIGVMPLYMKSKEKLNFLDKTTLFIAGSTLLQMFFAAHLSASTTTITEKIGFTTAMMLWRSIFTIPFCFNYKSERSNQVGFVIFLIIIVRAFASFATQLTFTWCVFEGNPLYIWPILSLTPLVASVASHIILKEKIHLVELFALCAFFLGTSVEFII